MQRKACFLLLSVTAVALLSLGGAPTQGAQEGRHPLTCLTSGETLPSIGAYSLFFDAGQVLCVAPDVDGDGTYVPCLRIGEVHVGQPRAAVEERLGLPFRTFEPRLPQFSSTAAYLVFRDSVEHRAAYYVVEYELLDGRELAFSVQLTGNRPELFHHFSCLHLEENEVSIRRQLDEPSSVDPFEAPESGVSGMVWSYDPLPVSIEVVDGKLYSFRVWRPDHVPPKERKLTLLEER